MSINGWVEFYSLQRVETSRGRCASYEVEVVASHGGCYDGVDSLPKFPQLLL